MKVYLAGPIAGRTDEDCISWRAKATKLLGGQTLDPMTRDYRGREDQNVKEIVELDKADVLASSHVLVWFDVPSVGTSMEVLYAWEHSIPVIIVCSPEVRISPWLTYHSVAIVHSLEVACELIKESLL